MSESGQTLAIDPEGLTVRSQFFQSLHDELTPPRFVLLRLLNLTVLRFEWVAELFKKIVVRRLMTGRKPMDLHLERRLEVRDCQVILRDRLWREKQASPARVFRARRLVGTHMATSRYFQEQELQSIGEWLEPVDWPAGPEVQLVRTVGRELKETHAG